MISELPIWIQRRSERYVISTSVTIDLLQHSFTAKTLDLSLGGARLRLPFCAGLFDFGQLKTVIMPEIGSMPATFVWKSDIEFGVRFSPNHNLRTKLENYLRASSKTTNSR